MKIHCLRAFTDNFIFIVEVNGQAMVVDPGDARPVQDFLKTYNLNLNTILLTHHHDDHVGGVKALNCKRVLGPAGTAAHVLNEGDSFEFEGSEWSTISVAGHTLDHLAYYNEKFEVLFCGDALFSLGCGRVFEGSMEQSYRSLQKLKALPAETRVYCAHEYTLANCEFHIQENVQPTADYLTLRNAIRDRLDRGDATIPSTIEFELKYNIFLRAGSLEQFSDFRQRRNQFKANGV